MNPDEIARQQEEVPKPKSQEGSFAPKSEEDAANELELEPKASDSSDVADDQLGIVGRTPG